jgi:hypothetical protein
MLTACGLVLLLFQPSPLYIFMCVAAALAAAIAAACSRHSWQRQSVYDKSPPWGRVLLLLYRCAVVPWACCLRMSPLCTNPAGKPHSCVTSAAVAQV